MPKPHITSRQASSAHYQEFKHIYPVVPVQIYEEDNPIAKHAHHGRDYAQENMRNEACGQLCNRLLLCMFAVCLLWATSLQVCVAIVGFNISIPSFSVVVANCNYAYSEVKKQRDGYSDCARRQMKQCDANLDTAYADQRLQVATLQQQNQRYVNQFQSRVSNCTTAVTSMKNAVTAWSAQGVEYTIPYQSNCTSTQRSAAATTLGDNTRSRASVYTASHAYTVQSDSTIVRLAEYTAALSSYNAQYLHNKTRSLQRLAQSIVNDISAPHIATMSVSFAPVGNVLDQLLACTSLANRTSLQCNYNVKQTLLQNFANQQAIMLRTVRELRASLMKATEVFYTLVDSARAAVAAANSFYESVAGPAGVINWIRNNVGSVGNLCGKSTPNYCSFSMASWAIPIPAFPPMPYVSYPVEAKVIWDAVSGIEIAERNKVIAMAAALNRELQQWMRDVHSAVDVHADFTPHDYDPPQYPAGHNASTEAALQEQRSAAFIDNVEEILSARNTTQVNSDTIIRLVNATNYMNLADSVLSEFATSFATFSGTSIDITLLVQSVLAAQSLLFLFDYIYRTFQTVRIASKFWRRGSVPLPAVDLRSTYDIADAWFVCVARVFDVLPFVSLQLLWLAMLVVLIIWGFAAVFVPQYTSYVNTCVEHTQNNTFISRNLYAVAYNYASSDGSGVITRGLGEYNMQSGVYCTSSAASSVQVYTALLSQLYAHNQTLTDNRRDLWTLSACINVPQLDSAFVLACCSEASYTMQYSDLQHCAASALQCPRTESATAATAAPYLPPGSYLASPSCGADNLLREDPASGAMTAAGCGVVVQPSTFSCQALPKCEITCAKPDAETIAVWTKHCSCMAEWYLNGVIVQTMVALLAYLLINISRVLLTRGAVQLLWRHLTPEIFDYTANCDGSGKLMNTALLQSATHAHHSAYDEETVDSDVTRDGEFQSALQKKIRQAIGQYERKGRILIVVALLINIPWIVLVAMVKNNIEYTPEEL